MKAQPDVGTDHCRVVPPGDEADGVQKIQFYRHLFAYAEAGRQVAGSGPILEIGAGEGYGANYLAPRVSYLVATDLSLQALRHATTEYHGLDFCQTLGTGLPFLSDTFAAVLAFQVIEHITRVPVFLAEVQRVLRPGGRFYMTTPNRRWRLLPMQRPWNPYHVREYRAAELRRVLRTAFDPVSIRGVSARPDILAFERSTVRQNPWHVYPAMAKWSLRKRTPPALWQRAQRLVVAMGWSNPMRVTRRKGHPVLAAPRVVDLFDFVLADNADTGMDLYAIGTKPDKPVGVQKGT
jgi:SAM-dependent methyltransferase